MRTAAVGLTVAFLLWGAGDALPKIEAENLVGEKVGLPQAAYGGAAILIIGFTHASQAQTKPWGERLRHDYPESGGVAVYTIAVLQDVPRLVRGMVVHSIKGGVPEEQRARFLLVYHKEDQLKRLVRYAQKDDAYLVVVDRGGLVTRRLHGPVSDAAASELSAQVTAGRR